MLETKFSLRPNPANRPRNRHGDINQYQAKIVAKPTGAKLGRQVAA
jgi:hypothetical protein